MATNNSIDFAIAYPGEACYSNPAGRLISVQLGSFANCLGVGFDTDSSGVLTVRNSNIDMNLTADNPGYIQFAADGSTGGTQTFPITRNYTLTSGTGSDISGARLGATSGSDWSVTAPGYMYAVVKSDLSDITFMISRNPAAVTSPAISQISKPGAIVNVGQSDFICMEDIDLAQYAQTACICLGSIDMTFIGSSNSWLFSLSTAIVGVNEYGDGTIYAISQGQNGSGPGSYFVPNAGTIPTFTSTATVYRIQPNGIVMVTYNFFNCTLAGVGANTLQVALPFTPVDDDLLTVNLGNRMGQAIIVPGQSYFDMILDSGTAALLNSDVALASTLRVTGTYKAFSTVP